MSEFDIDYQNYDKVFKSSFSIFKDEIMDFLGVDLPEIDSFLETEFSEIQTSEERLDLNFRLKDGSILHLEEQADISTKDLIRFASYDLRLYNRYLNKVRTIILCVNGFEESQACFEAGSINYNSLVIDMSKRDGDAKLEEIKNKIVNNEEVNVLELIFLPLMSSKKEMVERVKNTIDLEQQLNLSESKSSKVVAMTLVMTDKFLTEKEISQIWEEYKMVKIFKYAEEKGKEKGLEEGRERLQRTAIKLLIKKFQGLSKESKKKIKEQDLEELEIIVDNIFEMEDEEDLNKYLN